MGKSKYVRAVDLAPNVGTALTMPVSLPAQESYGTATYHGPVDWPTRYQPSQAGMPNGIAQYDGDGYIHTRGIIMETAEAPAQVLASIKAAANRPYLTTYVNTADGATPLQTNCPAAYGVYVAVNTGYQALYDIHVNCQGVGTGYFQLLADNAYAAKTCFVVNVGNFYVDTAGALKTRSYIFPGTSTAMQAIGYLAADASGNILVGGAKAIFINDTACVNVTTGIVINQGEADNSIFVGKSSDVAHGVTGVAETDTYAYMGKMIGASGGIAFTGLSNINRAWYASAICATAPDTTKSTAATGALEMRAYLKSGTGTTVVGADGNLLVVSNGGTTRFIFDAEGSAHADVEFTTFESENDLALLEALESELVRSRYSAKKAGITKGNIAEQNRLALAQRKLVTWPKDGEKNEDGTDARAMLNLTRLQMLLTGAIRQVNAKVEAVAAQQARLEARIA